MTLAAFPLTWPAGWPRTVLDGVYRVLDELGRFNVMRNDIIISTNLRTRLDGLPRSDQPEPGDPGVAVYWEDKDGGTKVMAIDRYDRVPDNLAAIAATLDAMRAIERHGGGQILKRVFTGFTALPAPKSCWDVLDMPPTQDANRIKARFKELLKLHHPDNGGDAARTDELVKARDAALETLR